jgi:propanol-preferring alcohol dehydrogenase
MRAQVLDEPAPIESEPLALRDVPVPEPKPGEIRLRVGVCGVCHTDLHEAEGDLKLPRRPVIPGHQAVGRIDALGDGVTDRSVGDRVGVAWLHETCGRCRFCRRGDENLCPDARFTGYHADGAFAEYLTVPAAFAYPVPEGVPDEQAAPLLCAGIIGYRAFRRSRVEPGGRLGLYGFGASAHVTIQVARHYGCEVYVFTRSPDHQAHARDLCAAWVGEVPESPPEPLDGSIIFAPAGELVPSALEALDKGGTLALAGIHMSAVPTLDYEKHLYHEKTLTSVTAATRDDGRDLMRLAGEIPIRTDVETFPLEEANRTLCRLKESAIRGAAVLRLADQR